MKRNIIALVVTALFAISIVGAYAVVKTTDCPMKSDKTKCAAMAKGNKANCPMTKEQKAKCMKMMKSSGKANAKSMEKCKNGVCPIPKRPGSKVSKALPASFTCKVCSASGSTMKMDVKKAAGKSVYKGKTYYFCSSACKTAFDKNPGKYAK